MRYSLPALLLLSACGPDSEQLERIVRLEAAVEALQVEVGELQEDAEKQQEAAEGPVKCAQAKKVAHDAWKDLVSVSLAADLQQCMHEFDDPGYCRSAYGKRRKGAVLAAVNASSGGAIRFKDVADAAAAYHQPPHLDYSAAIAASAASWEACKDVDP